LDKKCATKEKEWTDICKTRAEEFTALAEPIAVLNDDESLELFNKVLPSSSSSLMQVDITNHTTRMQALTSFRL